jgi:hypothetical protein
MSSSDSQRGASIRGFVKKFNTENEFRENFLNEPIGHLEQLGWTNMTDSQKQELREIASEIASDIKKSAEYTYTIDITDTTVIVRLYNRI